MTALLASGRDADIYAIDDQRVLRRYRRGGDVTGEADVMRYVADHGYPVPRVYAAEGADLILERLDGPTMLQALADGTLELSAGATVLADLLERLHKIRVRAATDPGTRILHLDLHPENVVMTEGGPVVIDWRNNTEGPPELDVAMTALIVAQVAVDPTHAFTERAEPFLDVFLGCTRDNPLSQLEAAVRRRGADPGLTDDERAHLHEAKLLVTTAAGPITDRRGRRVRAGHRAPNNPIGAAPTGTGRATLLPWKNSSSVRWTSASPTWTSPSTTSSPPPAS